MRKSMAALCAGAAMLLGPVLPSAASAQGSTNNFLGTYYICDGNGAGSCKSLVPGASKPADGQAVFAYGRNNGAWRWDVYSVLENGQTQFIFQLHAYTNFCNGNSAGDDVVKGCDGSASERWRFTSDGELVNIGRTNDKGTLEVLCNPGGGGKLVIVPPADCTAYHETWALIPG